MQWILHDIPIGRNIQNIRIRKNMTQLELITKMQLMGSNMSVSYTHLTLPTTSRV